MHRRLTFVCRTHLHDVLLGWISSHILHPVHLVCWLLIRMCPFCGQPARRLITLRYSLLQRFNSLHSSLFSHAYRLNPELIHFLQLSHLPNLTSRFSIAFNHNIDRQRSTGDKTYMWIRPISRPELPSPSAGEATFCIAGWAWEASCAGGEDG